MNGCVRKRALVSGLGMNIVRGIDLDWHSCLEM